MLCFVLWVTLTRIVKAATSCTYLTRIVQAATSCTYLTRIVKATTRL